MTAGWCHVPKDDIYGVGAEGEVKWRGVNKKKSSVKTLSRKREYFLAPI